MSWQLSVISGGREYSLSDNQNYLLLGIDGLAAAPVTHIVERGPLQHGESSLGFRLRARTISLVLLVRGGDDGAWFRRRTEIMRIFRISDSPVQLRITGGGLVRQIDCYLSGAMEMTPEVGLSPAWQRVGLSLYAPNPAWYDPEGNSIVFTLGGGDSTVIPLEVPVRIGASSISSAVQVWYTGTWDSYPIITLRGPISHPVITNQTTGDRLDFTGTIIQAGDYYVVDCRYGYKTVTRGSDGSNRVRDLSADSNLATFRLVAHPDVMDGLNSIRVSASGLTADSRISLQYNTFYVGV